MILGNVESLGLLDAQIGAGGCVASSISRLKDISNTLFSSAVISSMSGNRMYSRQQMADFVPPLFVSLRIRKVNLQKVLFVWIEVRPLLTSLDNRVWLGFN